MIRDIRDITSFKWATVTGTAPLAIRLDGDTAPLALIPESLIDPLTLANGDRVRVELTQRKVVIHGVANKGALSIPALPVLPDAVNVNGAATQTVTATTWALLPNIDTIAFTITRPLLVLITYGAWMSTQNDLRCAPEVIGATLRTPIEPNWGQVMWMTGQAGAQRYSQRSGQKSVLLNAGTSTIRLMAYRSGSGTDQVNYSTMNVTPIRWT